MCLWQNESFKPMETNKNYTAMKWIKGLKVKNLYLRKRVDECEAVITQSFRSEVRIHSAQAVLSKVFCKTLRQ